MAGDWIKMRCCLPTDPRVVAMARRLGVTPEHIVGCLLKVWAVFDMHTVSGFCPGYSGTDIDQIAGQPGMGDAMVQVEWLRVNTHGAEIPDFDLHNGDSAKKRAYEQKRKSHRRKMSRSCPTNPGTKSGQKAGPEKRREEYKKEESTLLSPEPPEKPRPANPIWDTLVELFALDSKVHATRLGKISRDLKNLKATPNEIRIRRARYLSAWPQAECSPEALVKHWGRFASDAKSNERQALLDAIDKAGVMK